MEPKNKKRGVKLYNVEVFISTEESHEELVHQLQHQLGEFRRNLYFCLHEEKGTAPEVARPKKRPLSEVLAERKEEPRYHLDILIDILKGYRK
jgi:hypothetical protein